MQSQKDPDTVENPLDPQSCSLPELPDLSVLDKQLDESLAQPRGVRRIPFPDPETPPSAITVESSDDPDEDDTCPWNQCCSDWGGPVLKMIDWKETEAAFTRRMERQGTDDRRVSGIKNILRSRGEYRKLQPIPPDWRLQLDALEKTFPNFDEVVDYLRVMYALAEQANGVPRLGPLLLNGEPGCGKSYFAESFARLYGSGYLFTHLETAQSNSTLSGSADYWSNTKPGEVFNLLVEKDFANPVICIDEIEKSPTRDYDPMSSLYGLLEPGTASGFQDLSYPWLPPLDASHIIWIATANNADSLPLPILDRFRRFDIAAPTDNQTRNLVKHLFVALVSEMPPSVGNIKISSEAIDQLIGLSPRRIKRLLREALGRVVYERRKRILARDISSDSRDTLDGKPPMGFV